MAACLLAWDAFLETVGTSKNAFTRSMRRYTADQWPARRDIIPDHCCQSAALVAVDRRDHALANRLATAVSSKVDKCRVKFWVAYGISKCVIGCDLFLWR